jgi:hypothetical protein
MLRLSGSLYLQDWFPFDADFDIQTRILAVVLVSDGFTV